MGIHTKVCNTTRYNTERRNISSLRKHIWASCHNLSTFLFSLFIEIGPSNWNIKTFHNNPENLKKYFWSRVSCFKLIWSGSLEQWNYDPEMECPCRGVLRIIRKTLCKGKSCYADHKLVWKFDFFANSPIKGKSGKEWRQIYISPGKVWTSETIFVKKKIVNNVGNSATVAVKFT